jgi:hypothetical protein
LSEVGRERGRRRKMGKKGNKVIPDLVVRSSLLKVTHERVKNYIADLVLIQRTMGRTKASLRRV